MALTDENVQELQIDVLRILKNVKEGDVYESPKGEKYIVIKEVNETTQGIAVAPIYKNKVDYSQTTIVIAGTQTLGNPHSAESIFNAITARVNLTEQTKDVRNFYHQSLTISKKMAGAGEDVEISNMSGFSQSGPAVAKVAAEMNVQRITNFMDWAAWSSLSINTGDISNNSINNVEVDYLKNHLHSYSDNGKDTTIFDGSYGIIPYGKVFTVEGTNHSPRLPKIKGNGLDIEWYVKNGIFCSGMTRVQVEKVVDKILKESTIDKSYKDISRPELIKQYESVYGSFAPELTKQDLISLNIKQIKELKDSLKTSSSSKKISLREELVRVSAETTKLQAEVYEEEIKSKIESEKEKVSQKISSLKSEAYSIAHHLPSSEVEVLLSELTLDTAWNSGKESETVSAASAYKNKMSQISDNLNKVADRIIESDQIGAKIFSN